MNIAIVGLGNIGSYLYKYLKTNKEILSKKNNCVPNIIFVSAKNRNKKTIFRFVQGVVVGSFVTIIVFYSLTYKEHERMHDLLEKHGIEKHEH